MIKKLHQIWLGNEPSDEIKLFIKTVRKYSTGWEYFLWTEKEIDEFDPLYAKTIKKFIADKKYSFAADLYRVIIIAKHGGCYADTDFEFYGQLDTMLEKYGSMLDDNKKALFCNEWGVTAGSFFYSPVANNPLIEDLVKDVHSILENHKPNYVSNLIAVHTKRLDNIYLLPVKFCFPYGYRAGSFPPENPPIESLMAHHWSGSWQTSNVRDRMTSNHKLSAKYCLARNPDLI